VRPPEFKHHESGSKPTLPRLQAANKSPLLERVRTQFHSDTRIDPSQKQNVLRGKHWILVNNSPEDGEFITAHRLIQHTISLPGCQQSSG
jgi:hypothetical protein